MFANYLDGFTARFGNNMDDPTNISASSHADNLNIPPEANQDISLSISDMSSKSNNDDCGTREMINEQKMEETSTTLASSTVGGEKQDPAATSDSETETQNPPANPVQFEKTVETYRNQNFWGRSKDFCMIEVLMQGFEEKNIIRGVSRNMPVSLIDDITEEVMIKPARVRIRSALLVAILDFIAESQSYQKGSNSFGERDIEKGNVSTVYLYPFKLFVRFEDTIRNYTKWLNARDSSAPENDLFVDYLDAFQSDEALAELNILVHELFDDKLGKVFSLRRALRDGTQTMLEFEDLWLLYEPGELVYNPKSSDPSPNNCDRLWRVTQYHGGRPILNGDKDQGTESKPKAAYEPNPQCSETNFIIRGFSREADSDFERAIPTQESLSIPPWDGQRDCRMLKAYPLHFCRSGEEFTGVNVNEFKDSLRSEGKKYCKLKQGIVQSYRGPAYKQDNGEWEYRSEVIIDTVRGHSEAPKLFERGPGPNPFDSILRFLGAPKQEPTTTLILRGERKEVQETPARTSAVKQKLVDSIHDDVNMEFEYFRHSTVVKKDVRISPKLSHLLDNDDDNVLLILPRMICGFVLSARTWANLHISNLEPHKFDKSLWDDVVLPTGYHDLLLAVVGSHPKTDSPERILHGKGTGTTILLQGHPGTGKTFTAEALAAKTDRVIYPITSGELGDTAAAVERNLNTFLQRGQRWNCILLLDEADVYLTKRTYGDSGNRNSIVSVFLRLIEYYTGIIVVTTNWFTALDPAFVNRVTLPLVYPPLDKTAIAKLWGRYMRCGTFLTDAIPKGVSIEIDPETLLWARDEYNARHGSTDHNFFDEKCPWHSARQIQNGFRLTISLVLHQWRTERERMGNHFKPVESSNEVTTLRVREEHFKRVFTMYEDFFTRVKDLPSEGKEAGKLKAVDEALGYSFGDDPPALQL